MKIMLALSIVIMMFSFSACSQSQQNFKLADGTIISLPKTSIPDAGKVSLVKASYTCPQGMGSQRKEFITYFYNQEEASKVGCWNKYTPQNFSTKKVSAELIQGGNE